MPVPVRMLGLPTSVAPRWSDPEPSQMSPRSAGEATQNRLIHKFYSWIFTKASELETSAAE